MPAWTPRICSMPRYSMRMTIVLSILLVVGAQAANHDILVQGLSFIPDDLTIEMGDSVTWTHDATSAFHTITNGTGTSDPEIGTLFDESFSGSGQTFVHVFADPGDVPYFCRPHLGLGMTGIIRVTANVGEESGTWSDIKGLWR